MKRSWRELDFRPEAAGRRRGVLAVWWMLLALASSPVVGEAVHVDPTFDPEIGENGVMALLVEPDQSIVVGRPGDVIRLLPDGSRDPGFQTPVINNFLVYCLARQPDGKIIMGGIGTGLGGQGIGRLHPDGSRDLSFNAGQGADSWIYSIVVQPDGRILVGGGFEKFNGQLRKGLARLNPDGSLDPQYAPAVAWGGGVRALALQPDGRLLVAGYWSYFGDGPFRGVTRLMPQGTPDPSFTCRLQTAGAAFEAVAVLADGRVVLGGYGGRMVVRLESDGAVDSAFGRGPDVTDGSRVNAIVGAGDGKILVGGTFGSLQGVQVERLARLLPDGAAEADFNLGGIDGWVAAIALQGEGRILVGGGFSRVGGVPCRGLIRLIPSGQPFGGRLQFATTSVPVEEKSGEAIVVVERLPGTTNTVTIDYATHDDRKLAGIDYRATQGTLVFGPGETAKAIRIELINDTMYRDPGSFLVRLSNPTGGAVLGTRGQLSVSISDDDTSLEFAVPEVRIREHVLTKRCDLTVLRRTAQAGETRVDFTTADGTAKAGVDYEAVSGSLVFTGFESQRVISVPIRASEEAQGNRVFEVRLSNPAGTVPPSPALGASSNVVVTIVDDNGPGGVDATFVPRFDSSGVVFACQALPDGSVMAGGFLTPHLARLLEDGSLDPGFRANPTSGILSMGVQSDGSVLAAERFTYRLRRYGPDGSADLFYPDCDGDIWQILVQPDQGILVLGGFTKVNQQARYHLARLNPDGSTDVGFDPVRRADGALGCLALQSDGKILVGGAFTNFNGYARPGLVRLHPDGSVDTGFDAGFTGGAGIHSLAVQPDGRIVVGGTFTNLQGKTRRLVARLDADGALDAGFDAGNWHQMGVAAAVTDLIVQADGKVIVGGAFTYPWPGNSSSPDDRYRHLVRFRTDGSIDGGFLPVIVGAGTEPNIFALGQGADGKVYVGGVLGEINGYPRSHLARLNNDPGVGGGSVAFVETNLVVREDAGKLVLSLRRTGGSRGPVLIHYAVEASALGEKVPASGGAGSVRFGDGETQDKALIIPLVDDSLAGSNRTFRVHLGNPLGGALVGHPGVARFTILDDDVEAGFATDQVRVSEGDAAVEIEVIRLGDPVPDFTVDVATRDATARAGRDYNSTQRQLNFTAGSLSATLRIPILDNPWGELDREFEILLSRPSGAVRLGRHPAVRVRIVDDDRPGSLDSRFNRGGDPLPGTGWGSLTAMTLQPDARLVVGGLVNSSLGPLVGLGRLRSDGTLDESFGSGGLVNLSAQFWTLNAIAAMDDGRFLAGGDSRIGASLLRLSVDGVVDGMFQAAVGGSVRAVLVSSAGQILVGGYFGEQDGVRGVLRLNPNGTVDGTFRSPAFSDGTGAGFGAVSTLAFHEPDGLLVGGDFGRVNGYARRGLARLHADGTLDGSFAPLLEMTPPAAGDLVVGALRVRADRKVLLSGRFNRVNGVARNGLARLNGDGSLDATFDPGSGLERRDSAGRLSVGQAVSILEEKDGNLVIAGAFDLVDGQRRAGLARLKADGRLDPLYDPDAGLTAADPRYRGAIEAALIQPDGRVVVAGSFVEFNSLPRVALARVNGGEILGFLSVGEATAGGLTLGVMIPQPGTYLLQRSADLRSWVTLSTHRLPVGPAQLRDETAGGDGALFYRLQASLAPE